VFVTRPSRLELRRRVPQLAFGLVAFGLGIALLVHAELGLPPWDVLHQGLSDVIGLPIGTVGILVGVTVLLGWIPLRQRMGIGTVSNALGVGLVIDTVLWALPDVSSLWLRVPEAGAGIVLMGLGCATYIGAGLGPGPRDGLMVGLHERGWGSVRAVRTGIELAALALGWALGGTVGVATGVQAVAIGPLVQLFLDRYTIAALEETPITAR